MVNAHHQLMQCHLCNVPVIADEYGFYISVIHDTNEYVFCSEYCKTLWEDHQPEWSDITMFVIGSQVQIVNHSEPRCNGQYGVVENVEFGYNNTQYYVVRLDDSNVLCTCTEDEVMEG